MQPAWKRGGGREDHGVKDFSRIGVRSSTEAAVPPTAACHLWEKGPGTSEAGRWGGGGGGGACQRDAQRSAPQLADTKPGTVFWDGQRRENKWTKSEIDESRQADALSSGRGGEMEESETDRQLQRGICFICMRGAPGGSSSARRARKTTLSIFAKR